MEYKIKVLEQEFMVTPETNLYTVSDFMGNKMHGIAIQLKSENPETALRKILCKKESKQIRK